MADEFSRMNTYQPGYMDATNTLQYYLDSGQFSELIDPAEIDKILGKDDLNEEIESPIEMNNQLQYPNSYPTETSPGSFNYQFSPSSNVSSSESTGFQSTNPSSYKSEKESEDLNHIYLAQITSQQSRAAPVFMTPPLHVSYPQKRKYAMGDSEEQQEDTDLNGMEIKKEAIGDDYDYELDDGMNENQLSGNKSLKAFLFTVWNRNKWATLYNSDYQPIKTPDFKVEADKGFFFSSFDQSFVCQKKNHFQITVHVGVQDAPVYLRPAGDVSTQLEPIHSFQTLLYGVKEESPLQTIQVRQSNTDRKPYDYKPALFKLDSPGATMKQTHVRLHFAQTTQNNNRKRGASGEITSNPDQRYFQLVVELQAVTETGQCYPVCAMASNRVIVRAVNPGQFKQEQSTAQPPVIMPPPTPMSSKSTVMKDVSNLSPRTDTTDESVANESQVMPGTSHSSNIVTIHGKLGINTASPDQALHVNGNVKVNGVILQPSDLRVKENIEPMNVDKALENILKLKLVKYDFKPEFHDINGGLKSDLGVLAQELREVIPDAVVESSDMVLSNGEVVENFLHVKKDRLNMECMGAIMALGGQTQRLDQKVEKIEKKISKKSTPGKIKKCFSDIKTFKVGAIVVLVLISLGVIGAVTIMSLKLFGALDRSSPPNSNNTFMNSSIFYPSIMPPVIKTDCAPNRRNPCRYCCLANPSRDPPPVFDVNMTESLDPDLIYRINYYKIKIPELQESNSTRMSAIVLFSADLDIYVALSQTGSCESTYCQEINGQLFYFIPVDESINFRSDFYLMFYLNRNYQIRSSSLNNLIRWCPGVNIIDWQYDMSSDFSLNYMKTGFGPFFQYIFAMPMNYFLTVDFQFRVTSMNLNYTGASCSFDNSVGNQTEFCRDVIFRFYRVCS